jgi:Uma2 family endonuclease
MRLLQRVPEFRIPDIKPAIELVRGERYRKVSPRTRHSLLQGRMMIALATWAGDRGDVGPEWRFYLLPPSEKPSSLVPDVAYVRKGRLVLEESDARERPEFAPDIAVEVLSPRDRLPLLETKVALYLANGASLIVVVDPEHRTVRMIDADTDRTFGEREVAASKSFDDLRFDVSDLFKGIV